MKNIIYKYTTNSDLETKKLGEILAGQILKDKKSPRLFALKGDLGSGKTTFMQGLAKGLEVKNKILSPTFNLMKKFQIPDFSGGKKELNKAVSGRRKKTEKIKNLYHFDCYRFENEKEILNLGFEKIISDYHNLVFLEWPEKVKRALPKETVWIKFKRLGENRRSIKIEGF